MENVKLRRSLERAILVALLEEARAADYTPLHVDDGGDELVKCKTDAEVIEAVMAVDDATVTFKKPGNAGSWARLIGGNGEDYLSDYGVSFDPVCKRVYERIQEVTVVLPRLVAACACGGIEAKDNCHKHVPAKRAEV